MLIKDLVYQTGFAGAGHAGHGRKGSQRDLHINALQVVLYCAVDRQFFAVARPPLSWYRDLALAAQVLAGDGALAGNNIVYRARCHQLAAVDTGTGTNVYHIVCRPHGVLVMFHHDQGVAQVPQVTQGAQQLFIVPLVQTNGRLIQNIQHTHQAGADLGSQTNALAFAAGQGGRFSRQRQIVQPHTVQEIQSIADFPHDQGTDHLFLFRQLQVLDKIQLLMNGHLAELINILAPNGHRQALRRQAGAAAVRAHALGHHSLNICPGPVGGGLCIPALQVGNHALKGTVVIGRAVRGAPLHFQLFGAGAV